jgi:hypothetical protein
VIRCTGERMRLITTKPLISIGICLLLSFLGVSCSSSNSNKGQTGGGTTGSNQLAFTSPTTNPTVEVANPPQSFGVTVNQNVTWSLQSGCGHGAPVGTLSNETPTSATYTAPSPGSTTTQLCTPWQDQIVATTSSNENATLSVVIIQTLATISNVSANTFGGQKCTAAGGPCCPLGSVTCCPPASSTTIIQTPLFSGSFGVAQVNSFTQIGPLSATGGIPPYTWQVSSGALPSGLTLAPGSDSTSMSIEGTPITPGCSTFAMQVTDSTGVASPQGPFTFNVVVIPAALKVTIPNYPAAYNDPANGSDPGIAYAPISLTTSSGTGPYTWVVDPNDNGSTLPPGMTLATSNSAATIQGTPAPGSDDGFNNQGNNSGLYPTTIQVSDSELPYPAVGTANLSKFTDNSLAQPCSTSNQAVPIQPGGTAVNGGVTGGGAIPAEAYLQGSLAFLLRGFDANGPIVIAGSVAVDGNGGVVGGEEDVTRGSGSQHLIIQSSTANPSSYYVIGAVSYAAGSPAPILYSYSRGCMTLATPAGNTTFAFTLGGCSNHWTENLLIHTNDNACGMTQDDAGNNIPAGYFTSGRIIEFDDCSPASATCTSSTRATGILRWQDSSSLSGGLSGTYAFGLSGWDATPARYAIAGSFQASSASLSSVAADIDDAGTLSSELTGGSGSYSTPDTYGNSTGTITVGSATLPISLYVVSKNEALLATVPPAAGQPIISGEAIATGSSFANGSLVNTEIFHMGGVASSGPDASVGILSFDGIGDVSGTVYEDASGTTSTTALSGQYQVDATTGRTAFTAPNLGQTLGAHSFVAYIVPVPATFARQNCSTPASCIGGFIVGNDSSAQDGILEFQTGALPPPPPFSNIYVEGDYSHGTNEMLDQQTPALEGVVYALPSGATTTAGTFGPNPSNQQSFIRDVSYSCSATPPQPSCVLLPSQSLTGSYTINKDGSGTFGGETVSVSNGNVIFYIDESPTNLHPSVVVVEQ